MTSIDRYNYAFDPEGDAWAARLLRQIPPSGSILELGPGPGAMTRVLKARGYQVTVVENNPAALETLHSLGVEVIAGDLDGAEWITRLAGRRFDIVLACDVLEHLQKPDDLLIRLCDCIQPMGRLIASIPNIAYAGVVASLRHGAFDYADKGQLDKTHVRFFTKRSIERMLFDTGWTPRFWNANRVPIENSEFGWWWNELSAEQRLHLLSGWLDFDVYQWMVVTTPSIDAHAWALIDERTNAEKWQEELHALKTVYEAEHASLLEHQKAFAQAKEAIEKLQEELAVFRVWQQKHPASGSRSKMNWLTRSGITLIQRLQGGKRED